MFPRFICLYGPDGVGKSTHVDLLVRQISSKGYKVKNVWIRGPHTLAFLLSFLLLRVGLFREISNPFGRVRRVPQIGANPFITQAWAFAEFLSVLPLIILKVMLPLRAGYIVVSDRYVMDTIVSIAYQIDDINFTQSKLARSLMCLLPKCSLLFHIDADYNTLIKRRGRLVEPRGFIEFQKEGYALLGNNFLSHYIDTSEKSIGITSSIILKKLERITTTINARSELIK